MKKEGILEFLKKQDKPMTSREIANGGKFNYNTVRKVLGELKKEGRINKVEEEGRAKYIQK